MHGRRSIRGAASTVSLLLAVAAFAVVGGFVYWLTVVTREGNSIGVIDLEPGVDLINMSDLRQRSDELVGEEGQIQNIRVSGTIGDHFLWVGPEDGAFLVKKDSTLLADTTTVEAGDRVLVVGTIWAVTDSVIDAWGEEGAYTNEQADRATVSFERYYMKAWRVTVYPRGN